MTRREIGNLVLELCNTLAEIYSDYPMSVRFHGGQRTYQKRRGSVSVLNFGLELLEWCYRHSQSTDYATVKRSIREIEWDNLTGEQAVRLVVLHEYAHILQSNRYTYRRTRSGKRVVHGPEFVKCFRELIDLAY